MKKITKTVIAILLIAILSMTGITAFAGDATPSPRLSHTSDGSFTFSATANGGYVDVTYYGYDSFVRADLTVKIEKSFLFFFWNEVDTWSASSTELNGHFFNTISLDGSGTYRAIFTLKITGNDGTVDTIERTIESRY
ncbi:MAG: hypothetical protein IKJ13_04455 [Clostridia bacterium]|nr:hypothetical protein [Clostridia bacterium]MBR3806073.1 hypothetical protein [Clostridia bacterium]